MAFLTNTESLLSEPVVNFGLNRNPLEWLQAIVVGQFGSWRIRVLLWWDEAQRTGDSPG